MAVECERILRSLPLWFGIEASLVEYVQDTQRFPPFVARRAGEILGADHAETRRFYASVGYVPLEVFPTPWGPRPPVLQLIKALSPSA